MLPEKHVREMRRLEKKISRRQKVIGMVLFLITFLIVGPIIHEGAHIAVLELINCESFWTVNISPGGSFGEVKPLCSMRDHNLIGFYSAGYLSTLLIGGILSIYSIGRETVRSRTVMAASIGTGMMASTMMAMSLTGDLKNISRILGAGSISMNAVILLIYAGCSITILRSLQIFWDESEGK